MSSAVRYLFTSAILLTSLMGQAAEDYFLQSSEKAVLSLALKAILLPHQEQTSLIATTYLHLEDQKNKKMHTVQVKTFEDFLQAYRNDSLFYLTELDDVSTIELLNQVKTTEYVSPNKSVQKKINVYLEKRKKFFIQSLAQLGSLAVNIFRDGSNKSIKDMTSSVEQFLTEKVDDLASKLNKNKTAQTEILSLLLKLYFKNLPLHQKIEIFYQTLHIPANSTALDVFFTLLNNSGPQMQKLLQIIGRSPDVPDEFKYIFQKLESQVKQVHWSKLEKLLLAEGLNLSDFEYLERQALGVGTMAQTHRAKLKLNGQRKNIVIRFLKPGIDAALKMDYDILKKIAAEIDTHPTIEQLGLPRLADLIDDLNASVVEELNVEKTVAQQKQGASKYQRSILVKYSNQKNYLNIIVPDAGLIGKNKQIMTQDLVFGGKPYKELSQYQKIYPDLYKVISEHLAETWIEEVFFRSGFFHADLHQGNLLLQMTDSSLNLSLLDFGMTGQLDPVVQQSALMLALGIKLQKAELIAKHFVLLSKSRMEPRDFLKKVQERIQDLARKAQTNDSVVDWTAWALDQGIELNYEFIKLNRGLKAIEMLLADSGSTQTFDSITKSLAFKNKAYVTKLLMNEKEIKIKNLFTLLGIALSDNAPKSLRCQALF